MCFPAAAAMSDPLGVGDPLSAAAAAAMEESICLDSETLASPDSEEPPPGDLSPLAQLDRPEPPLPEVRREGQRGGREGEE